MTQRERPSPQYVCCRPSCGVVYRYLSFNPDTPPPCPACGQPYFPSRGRRLTRLLRRAAQVSA